MSDGDTQAPAGHFDALFERDADPWRTRTRWYERRKRALTLAVLPNERYERACEPGCGAGETTAALALRCGSVVASDASAAAVRQARERLAGATNVRVDQARMPRDWPAGRFDLVVVSELGYYLSGDELDALAEACRASLTAGATLVACHWRRVEPDMLQRAHEVHAALRRRTGLRAAAHYEDDDFLLDAWTDDARSVAQREGLA
jgi:SAM-dependent methyltransferase